MNLFAFQQADFMVKTHFANLYPRELPPFIPPALSRRAIYIVRDPRDVCLSFSRYFGHSIPLTCDIMNSPEYIAGGEGHHAKCYVSSWSGHVASWIAETSYPIHLVRYEDLVTDAAKELVELVNFLEWDLDEERIVRAVESCEVSKLMKIEQEKGFRENPSKEPGSQFFNGGGSRWQDELGPKWARRIENDHENVMRQLGYLEGNVVELKSGEGNEH